MEIRRDKAHTRIDAWASGYDSMYLYPWGGWLIAVTVQIDWGNSNFTWPDRMPLNKPLRFEVTDENPGSALLGSFDIDHDRGYDQGGIVFDEPLPNINSATRYILRVTNGPAPASRVYSLNCRHVQ